MLILLNNSSSDNVNEGLDSINLKIKYQAFDNIQTLQNTNKNETTEQSEV